MRSYETMLVLSTQAPEGTSLVDRFASIIEREGGTIDARHDWGVRSMAYQVRKQSQGHYWLLEYQAGPDVVRELERNLRITEGVLRYLSVQQEHTGLPEPRSEERDRDDRDDRGRRDGRDAREPRRDAPLHQMRSTPPAQDQQAPPEPSAAPAAAEPETPEEQSTSSSGTEAPTGATPETGEKKTDE